MMNLRLAYQIAEYTSHTYEECTLGPNFICSNDTIESYLGTALLAEDIGIFLLCKLVLGFSLVGLRKPNPPARSVLSLFGKFYG
jgi:hypothetical protein